MTIEIRCPGCGRELRLADEHAGKQIRCPACQQICLAPHPEGSQIEAASSLAPQQPAAPSWFLRPQSGPTYGPVTWQEIQRWTHEGRISADCELGESSSGPWRPAGELFPALLPTPQIVEPAPASSAYPWSAAAEQVPGLSASLSGDNPFSISAPAAYLAPHRGGLILVLGLLGFVTICPIFSLMAWVMGSHDLNEMRSGRMDRSGEGPTQAGQILGMILSLLWMLVAAFLLLIIVVIAIAAGL